MAPSIRIIADSTTYHFAPGGTSPATPYDGSGTDWTSASTTPFEVAMNDATGPRWSPRSAEPQIIIAPSPITNTPVVAERTYDPITETMPVQVRGTTKGNAIEALQALLRALDTGEVAQPPLLYVEMDTTHAVTYYEILSAVWRDVPRSYNEELSQGLIRGELTITRQPFGGDITGETVINAVTIGNAPTAATDNVESMGTTGSGDLTSEGQPAQIVLGPPTATIPRFYMASVQSVVYTNSGFVGTATNTATYTTVGTATLNLAALLTRPKLSVRLLVRFSAVTTNAHVIKVLLALNGGSTYYTVDASTLALGTTATGRLLDLGDIPVPLGLISGHSSATANLTVTVQALSQVGAGNITVNYVEALLYYEFCQVRAASVTTAQRIVVEGCAVQSNRVLLPLEAPRAFRTDGSQMLQPAVIEGEAPKYRRGASFWLAMLDADEDGSVHNTGRQATLTMINAPLYRSLRND